MGVTQCSPLAPYVDKRDIDVPCRCIRPCRRRVGGFRARLRIHLPSLWLGMDEPADGNGVGRSRRCPLHERPRARAAAIVATCLPVVVSFLWMPYLPRGLNYVDSL